MFPSNFGITVATGFFFILKINSELAHMFANVFLGFVVFSRCLPSIPPAPLIAALYFGTGGYVYMVLLSISTALLQL